MPDIRTVKEWLGHKDIKTTMPYLRFVEGHAEVKFRPGQTIPDDNHSQHKRLLVQVNKLSCDVFSPVATVD